MGNKSRIEWTDTTWNPVTGCSKISPGCKNCYAERMSKRLKAMGQKRYRNGFAVTLQPDLLDCPFSWKSPKMIFVNSMSDLFHNDVPIEYIKQVFDTIKHNPHHTFQVLTKRSTRLVRLAKCFEWPSNLWMGVSVENLDYLSRIEDLYEVPAALRFVSFEPLLGPVGTALHNIDWVIVGGESGPGARHMEPEWVHRIKDECICRSIPFFFKQWGGTNKKKNGRLLEGRTFEEMPQANNNKWR
jgi:protein gp37